MQSKPSSQNQIGEQIGKELRAIYDIVLNEPVPDRFLALVDRLGEEMTSTARDPRPAPRRAAPQKPVAARSLPRGVKRLEPA